MKMTISVPDVIVEEADVLAKALGVSRSTGDRSAPNAADLLRGVARLMLARDAAVIAELPLADGRRADLVALDVKGGIAIVEIKSCPADFRADHKWPTYRQWCDRFYFAVAMDFPRALIPCDAGLIVADRYGGEVVREAPEHPLAPARRKAVTLRFARAAALRLQGVVDPLQP